eukprot:6213281-Pleurochrysis_carterae.AAC.1
MARRHATLGHPAKSLCLLPSPLSDHLRFAHPPPHQRYVTSKATECMHNRLHAASTHLRPLPAITANAPAALAHGCFEGCSACTEANATRHVQDFVQYKPSFAGLLIHADIAGPFVRTHHTGFRYL